MNGVDLKDHELTVAEICLVSGYTAIPHDETKACARPLLPGHLRKNIQFPNYDMRVRVALECGA